MSIKFLMIHYRQVQFLYSINVALGHQDLKKEGMVSTDFPKNIRLQAGFIIKI